MKTAKDVEKMMLQYVVQGVYDKNQDKYQIKITEDTTLEDNAPLPAKKQWRNSLDFDMLAILHLLVQLKFTGQKPEIFFLF